jgi:hypothetical protein
MTYPPGNPSGRADYSSSRDAHIVTAAGFAALKRGDAHAAGEPFARFTLAVCSESYVAGIGASMRTSYA